MPRGVYQRRPRGAAAKPAAVKTVPLAEAIAEATGLDPAGMDLGEFKDVQVAGVTVTLEGADLDEPEQPRLFLSGAPIVKPVPAPAPAPSPISCTMAMRLWKGKYPVWQCAACRVDTLDPALAKCPKGLPK